MGGGGHNYKNASFLFDTLGASGIFPQYSDTCPKYSDTLDICLEWIPHNRHFYPQSELLIADN